jgi:hypothetical protein
MERRYEHAYRPAEHPLERDRQERRRLLDGPDPSRRRPLAEMRGRDARPVREWEHERSSGSWRGGEDWDRSPREHDTRYGYGPSEPSWRGRGANDDEPWRSERYDEYPPRRSSYDDRHNGHDSPAEFGERSYAGYGDWDERDDMGALHGAEERYGREREPMQARGRSGAARWGLGRSGMHDDRSYRRRAEEVQAGRFAGHGPRGYQRSDERIREDVCDMLLEASDVDASDVAVHVNAGEVTLEGSVPDRAMKRAAEDIADEVSGVVQVNNQLRVRSNAPSRAVDAAGNPVG